MKQLVNFSHPWFGCSSIKSWKSYDGRYVEVSKPSKSNKYIVSIQDENLLKTVYESEDLNNCIDYAKSHFE